MLYQKPAPSIQRIEFVLWQSTRDQTPQVVGYGQVYGSLDAVQAEVHVFPTPCQASMRFNLIGSTEVRSQSAHVVLNPIQSPSQADDLPLTLNSGINNQWVALLPFVFTYRNINCPGIPVIHAVARPGPALQHVWLSNATSGFGSVHLTLFQTIPDRTGTPWLWGTIRVNRPGCAWEGTLAAHPISQTHTLDTQFAMTNNSTITLTNLPTNLNPDPSLNIQTTLQFTGGKCDGQTFPVMLISR